MIGYLALTLLSSLWRQNNKTLLTVTYNVTQETHLLLVFNETTTGRGQNSNNRKIPVHNTSREKKTEKLAEINSNSIEDERHPETRVQVRIWRGTRHNDRWLAKTNKASGSNRRQTEAIELIIDYQKGELVDLFNIIYKIGMIRIISLLE